MPQRQEWRSANVHRTRDGVGHCSCSNNTVSEEQALPVDVGFAVAFDGEVSCVDAGIGRRHGSGRAEGGGACSRCQALCRSACGTSDQLQEGPWRFCGSAVFVCLVTVSSRAPVPTRRPRPSSSPASCQAASPRRYDTPTARPGDFHRWYHHPQACCEPRATEIDDRLPHEESTFRRDAASSRSASLGDLPTRPSRAAPRRRRVDRSW
jgi:hypothetical protein